MFELNLLTKITSLKFFNKILYTLEVSQRSVLISVLTSLTLRALRYILNTAQQRYGPACTHASLYH